MKIVGAAVVAAVLVAAGCSTGGSSSGSSSTSGDRSATVPTDSAGGSPSWLFVQSAQTGEFAGPDGGELTLTLGGVESQTIAFSDRPVRRARPVPTAEVVQTVVDSDDPPNAAVVWQANGEEQVLIVELSDGEYDEAEATLTYRVTVLEQDDGSLADFGSSVALPTGEVGPVSLYVDASKGNYTCAFEFKNQTSDVLAFQTLEFDHDTYISADENSGVHLEPVGFTVPYYTEPGFVPSGSYDVVGGPLSSIVQGNPPGVFHADSVWDLFPVGCAGTFSGTIGSGSITVTYASVVVGSNSYDVDCRGYNCNVVATLGGEDLKLVIEICGPVPEKDCPVSSGLSSG